MTVEEIKVRFSAEIDNFKKKLEAEATSAIYQLSDYLYRYYKKKVIQE